MEPKIIDYPSPNFFISGREPRAIVLHGTAGPLLASLANLTNPRKDDPEKAVSANYLIDKNGDIYRLVPWWENKRAYGNGIVRNPDSSIEWLAADVARGINPNLDTISIEHVATRAEMIEHASMTDAQFNSSTWLTNKLLKDCGLQISNQTVIGHNQIDSIDKAFCPGVINVPAYIEVLKLRESW